MNILYSAITTLAILVGIYNSLSFDQLKYLDLNYWLKSDKLGAFTEITTSDTLAGFPTVYNANLGQTMIKSTTTLYEVTTANNLTSASSLATVGTITTGTWNADAISVSKGGSGTTSPSLYQVVLGNGQNGLTIASSTGTTGQFLTSNGSNAYPSWQTSAVSQSSNYNFTGTYFGVKSLYASSTLVIGGITNVYPSVLGASSTVMTTDASGNLVWDYTGMNQLGETILTVAQATATVSSIPPKKDLQIIVSIPTELTTACHPGLEFNDVETNYFSRTFKDYTLSVSDLSNAFHRNLLLTSNINDAGTTSPMYFRVNVDNESSFNKFMSWNGMASTTNVLLTGAAHWDNTSQINQVQLICCTFPGAGNACVEKDLPIGTRVTILGGKN